MQATKTGVRACSSHMAKVAYRKMIFPVPVPVLVNAAFSSDSPPEFYWATLLTCLHVALARPPTRCRTEPGTPIAESYPPARCYTITKPSKPSRPCRPCRPCRACCPYHWIIIAGLR
ncbi:hypothetical protein M426DRAFT_155952 [Hypoxylon sp. CI-4A]|nr:hypothetical protein M426DRAFT_155952 [Hypoxylon sp. CI-4A]